MIDKTGGAIGEKATFFFGEQGKIGLPHSCDRRLGWVGDGLARRSACARTADDSSCNVVADVARPPESAFQVCAAAGDFLAPAMMTSALGALATGDKGANASARRVENLS
jgi:hypothetical protein